MTSALLPANLVFRAFTQTGTPAPLAGGILTFFQAGTSTPQAVYSDATGTVSLGSTITLDANGQASFWLKSGLVYKINLTDAALVQQAGWPKDGVVADPGGDALASLANNLSDSISNSNGDALIAVKSHVAGFSATTQDARNGYTYFANEFTGVDATGVSDSTSALTALFSALPAESTIIFNPGTTYKVTAAIPIQENLTIIAYGATFNLSGNNAGFAVKQCTRFHVKGGKIVGDGVLRDGTTTGANTAQIGWSFGNDAGTNCQNVTIEDVWIESTNNGIRFAYGTSPTAKAYNCKVINSTFKNMATIELCTGGFGYGVYFAQANRGSVVGCTFDGCMRHGLYFSEGSDYQAVNCTFVNHRQGMIAGNIHAALEISRCQNVSVSNCTFNSNYCSAVGIDTDMQGLSSTEAMSEGTSLSNCTFRNNTYGPDITVGTTDPSYGFNGTAWVTSHSYAIGDRVSNGGVDYLCVNSHTSGVFATDYSNACWQVDGVPRNVTISNCTFEATWGFQWASLQAYCFDGLRVNGCTWDMAKALSTLRPIAFSAVVNAAYSNNLMFTGNTVKTPQYGIQLWTNILTGSGSFVITNNTMTTLSAGAVTEYDFQGVAEAAITNSNLRYTRSNGKCYRNLTASGTGMTLYAGGVDGFYLQPGSASTYSAISGGTEGQEVTLYCLNANTTIKETASAIYLAGGVDFVSTPYDTLTLCYLGGAWREKCRSLNA